MKYIQTNYATITPAIRSLYRGAIPLARGESPPEDTPVCLNVNECTADELATVDGISHDLAEAIADSAPFDSVDELTEVQGIGPATLGRIGKYLTV